MLAIVQKCEILRTYCLEWHMVELQDVSMWEKLFFADPLLELKVVPDIDQFLFQSFNKAEEPAECWR